jgi:hypothetical protein
VYLLGNRRSPPRNETDLPPLELTVMEKLAMARQPSTNLNDTDRRGREERRNKDLPVTIERRKVQRRRQIDPTTCEREYSQDEVEFMQALDQYKRDNGRMFPTCSEILEVLRKIGYVKLPSATTAESTASTRKSDNTASQA